VTNAAPTPRPAASKVWLDPCNLALLAAVLGIDYGLKRFASQASAGELDFLLAPTAAWVHLLTGHTFVAESGAGYFSHETLVVIAPACAGMNFAIIAFTALVAGYLPQFRAKAAKLGWVFGAGMLAYGVTVFTNGARIALGLAIGRHGALSETLSAGALHRLIGISVYLSALLALSGSVSWALRRKSTPLAPVLGTYLAVTIVTPVLGGASASRVFCQHAGVVLGLTALAAAVLWLPHRAYAVAFIRWVQGAPGNARFPFGLGRARRDRERPLPG
jgi:exosortase K